MSRPVIITCAVTGGADTPSKHPGVPITPAQIADSALGAARAGAAVVHIHVRDPETGAASGDPALFREVAERIRASAPELILNLTTGEGGVIAPSARPDEPLPFAQLGSAEARSIHVQQLRPELSSLDMGSMNFGRGLMVNAVSDVGSIARAIRSAGVRPELEVFDAGHVQLAVHMIERGEIDAPALFQLCLGVPWGAPATPASMLHLRDMLPPGSTWCAFGIGASQFPMVAQAVLLGGHVRVGLEDNLYLERGELAADNAVLVQKAAQIVRLLGERVATPDEAREILKV